MKHANVAIFVPHIGCPNQCSFCNQRTISGAKKGPTPEEVAAICYQALEARGTEAANTQVAFFGGSFTAIPRDYMLSLLQAVQPFLGEGGFQGIRISTRPDAIDDDILKVLLNHKVTAIELGVQSMDDAVLLKNRRGHTSTDVHNAVRLIRKYPFELGLQMMLGLPGDTVETMRKTAQTIADFKPDTVRIYPTLVLRGTELDQWYQTGKYTLLSLEEAVYLGSEFLELFQNNSIQVIRAGLHASVSMEEEITAGPYHPAFRELCESRIYLNRARKALEKKPLNQKYHLFVKPSALSKMIGQGRENLLTLEREGYNVRVKPKDGLDDYEVLCKTAERKKGCGTGCS